MNDPKTPNASTPANGSAEVEMPRPTIEELERILASNASLKIEIQPDGSIRAVPSDAAKRAVVAVLQELRGRKGFSHWWDDIRADDQSDIIKCAEEQVARVLQPLNDKIQP